MRPSVRCARERPLFHDATPGAIDDPDAGLDAGERVLAEQMARVPRERYVERDEVGAREQLVKVDGLDAVALGGLARQIGVVGDHVHAEAECPPRDLGPDASEPQHAQHLAEELDALQPALLPAAGLERGARHQHDASDLGGATDDQAFVLADARDEGRLRKRLHDVDLEPLLREGVDADGLQAVGHEDPLHDFSAKIFCAARTLAPKSTGWPRSASTCSRAESAMITSNSAAYPMWPSRKTLPFISPCPPAIVMLWRSEERRVGKECRIRGVRE